MKRRLYFLFPDSHHLKLALADLRARDLTDTDLHVLAREGMNLEGLPAATLHQRRDDAQRLEKWLWNANLAVFFAALVGLLWALSEESSLWVIVAAAVMITTFVLGLLATHLPDVHIEEMRDAITHGELLLMVDVPRGRVGEIEDLVHQRHPEATVGGVSWTFSAFGY